MYFTNVTRANVEGFEQTVEKETSLHNLELMNKISFDSHYDPDIGKIKINNTYDTFLFVEYELSDQKFIEIYTPDRKYQFFALETKDEDLFNGKIILVDVHNIQKVRHTNNMDGDKFKLLKPMFDVNKKKKYFSLLTSTDIYIYNDVIKENNVLIYNNDYGLSSSKNSIISKMGNKGVFWLSVLKDKSKKKSVDNSLELNEILNLKKINNSLVKQLKQQQENNTDQQMQLQQELDHQQRENNTLDDNDSIDQIQENAPVRPSMQENNAMMIQQQASLQAQQENIATMQQKHVQQQQQTQQQTQEKINSAMLTPQPLAETSNQGTQGPQDYNAITQEGKMADIKSSIEEINNKLKAINEAKTPTMGNKINDLKQNLNTNKTVINYHNRFQNELLDTQLELINQMKLLSDKLKPDANNNVSGGGGGEPAQLSALRVKNDRMKRNMEKIIKKMNYNSKKDVKKFNDLMAEQNSLPVYYVKSPPLG
jgi:hypothetical protein